MSDVNANAGVEINPLTEGYYYGLATSPFVQDNVPKPISNQVSGIFGLLENPYVKQLGRMSAPLTAGGFAMHRLQNTLIRGGIGDDQGVFRRGFQNIFGSTKKYGRFRKGNLLPDDMGPNRFLGGTNIFGATTARGRRLSRVAGGGSGPSVGAMNTGMAKGFFRNNRLLNPRRFSRLQNLSAFGAGQGRPYYAPFGLGAFSSIGNLLAKPFGSTAENPFFGGGMLARIGAAKKIEQMSARGMSRAVATADMNIARVMAMNNPISLLTDSAVAGYTRAAVATHGTTASAATINASVRQAAENALRDTATAPLNDLRKIAYWSSRIGSPDKGRQSIRTCAGTKG
jgi:hypothetical protein